MVQARHGTSPSDRRTGLAFSSDEQARVASKLRFWSLHSLHLLPPHGFDDLADSVDHKLRLLFVYLVATMRIGDVLCVRHKRRKLVLRLFLRGISDVPEIWWNIFR